MTSRSATAVLGLVLSAGAVTFTAAEAGAETFTARATVTTASGATATAPVTIEVTDKLSQEQAAKFTEAYRTGGEAALRKALTGVPPMASVRFGDREPARIRLALERATDQGRLITLLADEPLLHLGAGLPGAKPKAGYDFAVLDLQVDATGAGTGLLAAAAKVRVQQGAFVVDDYASETIRLTDVKKTSDK
jgi:hypothetical protein